MEHRIEKIDNDFVMTAYGVVFENFEDWEANAAKTANLKSQITGDGRLDSLVAKGDGKMYQVNYADQVAAKRGFGTMGAIDVEGTDQFPFLAGDYLVFTESGSDKETLADQITLQVFGGGLADVEGYIYVGPGNYVLVTDQADGTSLAEMWLRVQAK